MRYRTPILLGLLLSITRCTSQVENSGASPQVRFEKKIDAFVADMIKEYKVGGGVGIGIVKEGKIIMERAYGYSNRDREILTTTRTPFYIASITKSFVGTLGMILHETNEIDLDEDLINTLPFELPDEIDTDDILVEDLFTHTSGIGNAVVPVKTAYTGNFTKEEIIHDFEEFSYPISPGYQYSNLGYILGAIILEEKLGADWKNLIRTRVLDPIGMSNTSPNVSFYEKEEIAKPHTLSNGIIKVGDFLKKDDTMHAAGGLFTTVEDMNKWMKFHLDRDSPLLSKEAFEYIHSDLVGYYGKYGSFSNYGYGLGWNQADWNEYEISWHGGGYPGYRSFCILVPEEKLGVVILMNQVTPAVSLLTDFLLGNVLEVPDFNTYLIERKKRISNQWRRYQFVRDSTLAAGSKKIAYERSLSDYEGLYLNEEFGEVVVKPYDGSLNILIGNLSFNTNYIGDDEFFFFNDADQMYGSIDFYFHKQDNEQASSLDFSGIEYTKVYKTGQNK